MFGRDKQRIKNASSDAFGISGPVRLSATMVELSMRQDRANPRSDIPPRFPIPTQYDSAKTRVQFTSSTVVTTEEKGNKAAQLDHGFARGERSRISISQISILALALLAFTVPFVARGHRTDSIPGQSRIPAEVQQREAPLVPVTTAARETTLNHAPVWPKKAKSRHRRDDVVAKDTYVYYGKDGKPNK